jgi:acetyl-CoA/propionyl-CoA carboxylase, biotin carboxylase, biotin carboxyl carrier protein
MQGTVLRVEVGDGEEVTHGQVLLIVEAMKMENEITAHRDGTARDLAVAPGDAVRSGQALLKVVSAEDA